MLAQPKRKKVRQKRKILQGLYAQNLMLVGEAPVPKRAPFNMKLPVWLGLLFFFIVFIATDTLGPSIRQGLAMFGDTPSRQAHGDIIADQYQITAQRTDDGPQPHYQVQDDTLQLATMPAQSLQDKKHAREYVNLIIQSLEDKSDIQEYADFLSDTRMPIKKMFGLDIKTIVIDAGHGGVDPGALGDRGLQEKNITLDIARSLKKRLEARNQYRVLLTRSSDTYIGLKERTIIANENGGDLFISIHVNFLPGRSKNIIETLYFGPSKNAVEMQLAEKENRGSGFGISDYNQLIKKLSSTMKLQESRVLAQTIQRNLFKSMHTFNQDIKDYGVKRAPFVVLLGAEMPGVLVEVSCLSNHEEEQRLRDPAYREAIAGYIETGVIKYLESRSVHYVRKRASRDIQRDLIRRN